MNGFIGVAFLLLGVIAALVGVYFWSRARKQLGWEGVDGTVRAASVVYGGRYYRPQIQYTYTYRGRELRGENVRSPTTFVNWRGPAERVVAKYRPGSTVTVFVDPENPRESVLERGGDPKFFVLALVVTLFFLIFGLMLVRNSGGAPLTDASFDMPSAYQRAFNRV